jgi:glutamyl-tRNA synthetase
VDDHDMGITHVIRGDDHLTNTFRQIQIYEAMAWAPPRFGHLPLIHGPDGAKLSKRHGAVSVLEFRNAGILPEALCNYLLRLGWGHGDAEIIDRAEAIKLFDIDGVGRAASRMDYAKLTHLNGVYIRAADDGRLTEEVLAHLAERPGLVLSDQVKIRIKTLMPGLKERAKSVVELANSATFLALAAPIALDDKARAVLTDDAKAMLRDLTPALAATDFTIAGIDAMLRTFAESTGRKLGQVAQPLRAVLTGTTTSPGIDSTLAALGREESLARIAVALGDDFSVSPGADLGEREQPKAQIREEF